MTALLDGQLSLFEPQPLIGDLSSIPWPDRRLLNPHHYRAFLLPRPATVMVTARGCASRCTFCIRSYEGPSRARPVEDVLAEWEDIRSVGIRSIALLDDTLFFHRERDLDLFDRLAGDPQNVWTCMTRVDLVDDEILVAAKRAGCRRITLGIERLDDDSLRALRKGYRVKDIQRAFDLMGKHDLEFTGLFILGAPGTPALGRSIELRSLRHSPLHFANVMSYTEYPGGGRDFDQHASNDEGEMPPILVHRARIRDELTFYLSFYLVWRRVRLILRKFGRHPADVTSAVMSILRYAIVMPWQRRGHQRLL